jgi:hypothetical protein
MIGDLIAQVVGEVVGYATGRAILTIFTPHIRIVPLSKTARPPNQGWFAFTYIQGGRKYYFDETVTATGILFWVAILVVIAVAWSR